jgi:hypothetical protein
MTSQDALSSFHDTLAERVSAPHAHACGRRSARHVGKVLTLAVATAMTFTCLCAQAASPPASSWDLSSEFISSASSPIWSYGSKLGSTFTPFGGPATSSTCTTGWALPAGLPYVGQNPSSSSCTTGSPFVTLAPRAMLLHPGYSGEAAVVRFKAPYAAQYRVSGQFYGIDGNGTGTQTSVGIVANYAPSISSTLYSGSIAVSSPSTPSYASFSSKLVMLQAGQTLDFTVRAGPGNNYFFGSTGLNAVIERAGVWCGPTNPADPSTSTC